MTATRTESLAAIRTERAAVLDFLGTLTDAEWARPSAAAGWTVQDVVTHMTGVIRAAITPAALQLVFSRAVERTNDRVVAESRTRTPQQTLRDFENWSARGITGLRLFTAPGVSRIPLRIGELGWYPLHIFPALYIFDWHTHLRHDLAPALDRPAPATDDTRMRAIVTWLMTLLEHSHRDQLSWLTAPIALTFTGPGASTWTIEPGSKLRVVPTTAAAPAAHIHTAATDFPAWSTTRRAWKDCDITIEGDTALATRFLDSINLV
ncbi:maleylpyruvate isomerase family mycothiol-dependent enzyme [Nocardia sp. NPDC057668]|uniref:maleylpyruvate isomerase family mycothiol-dependent enzyme n=1 Tax=Nocardia sp. NPDC057668 TaxID=3346202 RepID=UPI003670EB6E